MIHVELQPEPEDFNANVRIPGNRFLRHTPHPHRKDWNQHSFWTACRDELYAAYKGVCAYTGVWFPKVTSSVSVDHFYPKSTHQELAYEWSNYRLTTPVMNSYKGDKIVLDPFEIKNGDLTIDFPSCLIKPRASMTPAEKSKALYTIDILHLNDESLANERFAIIISYICKEITKSYLEKRYPFIASELHRQKLYDTIGMRFKGRGVTRIDCD